MRVAETRIDLGLAALVVLAAPVAHAAAATHPLYPAIHVIPAAEVLRDHTETGADGLLYFVDASGTRWKLLTSVWDPEIANPGDGEFHAMEGAEVLALLDSVPGRFLSPLSLDIFLLPYPRAGALSSGCSTGAIYLSPGVRPYTPEQVARLTAHELGHAVQRAFLTDSDIVEWGVYRSLRRIEDPDLFRDDAAHAWRPREIFAEDFRVLCGGELAAGDGSVENSILDSPRQHSELISFIWALPGGASIPAKGEAMVQTATTAWIAYPNPARTGEPVYLQAPRAIAETEDAQKGGGSIGGGGTLRLVLFDATGREIGRREATASLDPILLNLRDAGGRDLPAGAYWVRLVFSSGRQNPRTIPVRLLSRG
jgi:hypothetical protein